MGQAVGARVAEVRIERLHVEGERGLCLVEEFPCPLHGKLAAAIDSVPIGGKRADADDQLPRIDALQHGGKLGFEPALAGDRRRPCIDRPLVGLDQNEVGAARELLIARVGPARRHHRDDLAPGGVKRAAEIVEEVGEISVARRAKLRQRNRDPVIVPLREIAADVLGEELSVLRAGEDCRRLGVRLRGRKNRVDREVEPLIPLQFPHRAFARRVFPIDRFAGGSNRDPVREDRVDLAPVGLERDEAARIAAREEGEALDGAASDEERSVGDGEEPLSVERSRQETVGAGHRTLLNADCHVRQARRHDQSRRIDRKPD